MGQLVQLVARKAGVQQEQAEVAIAAAREYLRGSLSSMPRTQTKVLMRSRESRLTEFTSSLVCLCQALQRFV